MLAHQQPTCQVAVDILLTALILIGLAWHSFTVGDWISRAWRTRRSRRHPTTYRPPHSHVRLIMPDGAAVHELRLGHHHHHRGDAA